MGEGGAKENENTDGGAAEVGFRQLQTKSQNFKDPGARQKIAAESPPKTVPQKKIPLLRHYPTRKYLC